MTNKAHRSNAEAARTAAAETELPNVRERNIRSAEAYEAAAAREEDAAANLKVRQEEAEARRVEHASDLRRCKDAEDDEAHGA